VAANIAAFSLEYSIVFLFALNIFCGLFFDDSMRYLWNLTHLLQLTRIITLVDLNTPEMLRIIIRIFKIAAGDFDEMEDNLPAIISHFIPGKEKV